MFDLTNPIFTDADKAREYLEKLYWPNGPSCRHCGNADASKITKLSGKSTRPGVLWCNECSKPFTRHGRNRDGGQPNPAQQVDARLPAHGGSSKKGMSCSPAPPLARHHVQVRMVAWRTAFVKRGAPTPKEGASPLGGEGQGCRGRCGPSWAARRRTRHASKRTAGNIGGKGKQIVHTLVERNGRARSHHVADVTGATLRPIIVEHRLTQVGAHDR